VTTQTEIELKFLVPSSASTALTAEMAQGSAGGERTSLAAMYLDTEDRRLARAGLAWRLRREGRRWIQTLKASGTNPLERFEHEVIRPNATHDANEHAGTPVGERLLRILRTAHDEGIEVGVRFQTEVRRTLRRVRTRGAVVEVALDEGRLLSNESSLRIREIEFELVSGSATAMAALAERWRKRFDLIYEPRTKAERGDQLATGVGFPPVRRASRLDYPSDATAAVAFGAVLDECLSHITRNAIGLCEGNPALRVEHVHQVRVGIRRLRSALRSFDRWTPAPADALVEDVRRLFTELGKSRDSDVLESGVAAELIKVGAPALKMPAPMGGADPAETVRARETQRVFLAWIAWRTAMAEQPMPAVAAAPAPSELQEKEAAQVENAVQDESWTDARTFHRNVERRLRRWHRRIVADWKSFDELDEAGLHALRKRIKRQRYAVEFFTPVLRRRGIERYLKPLGHIQDRMGELNDLFVARARYQPLVEADPAAWFALGWITARIAEVRAQARPELGRLAETDPPTRCAS
jgi:inorganic triphosphatase YgiF